MKELYPCQCCGNLHFDRVLPTWAECPKCGVYVNMNYSDPPIQEASGIKTELKEVLADIEKFVPVLDHLKAVGPLYDVCAGIGTLPYLCRLRGIRAGGNDLSPGAVAVAKDLLNVWLELAEFEDIASYWSSGSMSEIVFHHGIEHVRSPLNAIRRAIAALKPGGQIYLGHPVMRDLRWLEQYGSAGHRHEWTYGAFDYFVRQFQELTVTARGHSEFKDGGGAGQYWVLRKAG